MKCNIRKDQIEVNIRNWSEWSKEALSSEPKIGLTLFSKNFKFWKKNVKNEAQGGAPWRNRVSNDKLMTSAKLTSKGSGILPPHKKCGAPAFLALKTKTLFWQHLRQKNVSGPGPQIRRPMSIFLGTCSLLANAHVCQVSNIGLYHHTYSRSEGGGGGIPSFTHTKSPIKILVLIVTKIIGIFNRC